MLLQAAATGAVGILTDSLTAGAWTGLGNPPGLKGYKYKNPAAPTGGAVKLAIVKSKVIKVIAKDDGTLLGPVAGDVAIELTTGADRYCATFGGSLVKSTPTLLKRKNAPAVSCGTPTTTTSRPGSGSASRRRKHSPMESRSPRHGTRIETAGRAAPALIDSDSLTPGRGSNGCAATACCSSATRLA